MNFIISLIKKNKETQHKQEFIVTLTEKNLFDKLDKSFDYVSCFVDVDSSSNESQKVTFGIDKTTIRLEHSLALSSNIANAKENSLTYETKTIIPDLKYVTVSCWESPIYIKNFMFV